MHLQEDQRFLQLFYILLGLKWKGATLVGQPTGSKLNFFGAVNFFTLPNSMLTISYSTGYFHFFKKDKATLMPDVQFPVYFHDYIRNYDPVMDYVLKQ